MAYNETYEEFVDKFKPKLTTDDCYTPPAVYEVVKEWAVHEYGWEDRTIVRPFYPGGDYERYPYTDDCAVIDNPPFSIMSKIVDFYESKGISYFLFAQAKTFLSLKKATSHIGVGVDVIFENGADIQISFVASEGPCLRTAPELYRRLKLAAEQDKPEKPRYFYPVNVITFSKLESWSKYGIEYKENNAEFVRSLDAQRELKKNIYGAGYIVPAERAAKAEMEKAERAAKAEYVWTLSDREKDIVMRLEKSAGDE